MSSSLRQSSRNFRPMTGVESKSVSTGIQQEGSVIRARSISATATPCSARSWGGANRMTLITLLGARTLLILQFSEQTSSTRDRSMQAARIVSATSKCVEKFFRAHYRCSCQLKTSEMQLVRCGRLLCWTATRFLKQRFTSSSWWVFGSATLFGPVLRWVFSCTPSSGRGWLVRRNSVCVTWST